MNRLTLTGQLLALAAGGVLLLGCGGNVQISSSGGGGAGGGGASGGGGAGGTTMTTTSTGGNTGGGGTGGAPVCNPPSSGFDMTLTAPDGSVWGCSLFDGTATGNLVFNAAVVKASGNALTLDACSPAADCLPILYELTLKAPGLNAYIDPGAYVHVQVEVAIPWGCYQRIQITNLPSWDGDPNPANPTKQLWLSAADGTLEVFNDSPFTIGKQILDCPGFQEGCGGDLPGQYDLRFSPGGDPSQTVIVPTGQSKMMSLLEGPTVLATNLRSFESGICDDYWNWAYLVTPAPIK